MSISRIYTLHNNLCEAYFLSPPLTHFEVFYCTAYIDTIVYCFSIKNIVLKAKNWIYNLTLISPQVVFIGGATPDVLYNDVWILNLQSLKCSRFEALGTFEARYEHSAFFPIKIISCKAGDDVARTMGTEKTYDFSRLWIFAGANTEENKNDFWELNFETQQWLPLSQNGEIPSPRTYHTTSACKYGPVIVNCLFFIIIKNTLSYLIHFMCQPVFLGSSADSTPVILRSMLFWDLYSIER